MELIEYINKNKEIPFYEKKITEVDFLIFSQLSYLILEKNLFLQKKSYSLPQIKEKISRLKNKKNPITKYSPIEILDKIANTKRYQECLLSNYIYESSKEYQFGAITIDLPTKEMVISFEGTDDTIAGWFEDAKLSYLYPTISQKKAGEYINKFLLSNKYAYICGHSKGGNLAVVGSMRCSILKRNHIIAIYSFDGPGVQNREFSSIVYKNIKDKIKNYIPEESIIGILFNQEKKQVIKSSQRGIFQHDVTSWEIEGDYLNRGRQSNWSVSLKESFQIWLEKYSMEERKKIVEEIFSLFSSANITNIYEINSHKINLFFQLLNKTYSLDKETKDLLIKCIKSLFVDIGSQALNISMQEIQNSFPLK